MTIGNIAGDTIHHRDLCLEVGCMDKLSKVLDRFKGSTNVQRDANWAISNLFNKIPLPPWETVCKAIPVFRKSLTHPLDVRMIIHVLWSLSYISGLLFFIEYHVKAFRLGKYIQEVIDMDIITYLISYMFIYTSH